MTTPDTGIRPVPVQHVNADGTPASAPGRKKRWVQTKTLVLTSTNPVDELLNEEPARVLAYLQAGGANVIIATSIAQAKDPANVVTGLPTPNGSVLPSGNTAPTPYPGSQRLWAAAASYPAQVSVVAVYEED